MQDLRYKAHSRAVGLWIEHVLPADDKLTPKILIDEFEALLNTLLNSIRHSVGETTLSAVADRVLYNSSGHHPMLMKIHVRGPGFDFSKLREDSAIKDLKLIKNAFHYFITELLFVIGKLSGGSLSPRLHSVLDSRVSVQSELVGKTEKDEK